MFQEAGLRLPIPPVAFFGLLSITFDLWVLSEGVADQLDNRYSFADTMLGRKTHPFLEQIETFMKCALS